MTWSEIYQDHGFDIFCPAQNGGPDLDNMKSSPTTAPTTPREGDQNLEFNMPNFPPGGENVSFCLLPTYNSILLYIKDPSVRLRLNIYSEKIGMS